MNRRLSLRQYLSLCLKLFNILIITIGLFFISLILLPFYRTQYVLDTVFEIIDMYDSFIFQL